MPLLSTITPEGVSLLVAAAVILASFFTSALTASFGLGGGLALLAVMSVLLPAPAVIPVHGIAQFGANFSRFSLQRAYVVWPIILPFALGSLIGAGVGGRLYFDLPEWLLKGGVGVFVLATTFGPKPPAFAPGAASFFATGAIGSFLSMFFGATGPIAATMLGAARLGKLETVATHAAAMVFQHGLKTLAFGVLGFAYQRWAGLIALILLAGFLGAVAGGRILRNMPETAFRTGFKAVLGVFGAYLIAVAILSVNG